ncbi:MAG: 4-hydroxy-tetrahydrodipicolinate reductase [Clostridia bacterium]|nr:4-hydroxy-tetrahydrodipicolinate reductase [Clostridia bacterium]
MSCEVLVYGMGGHMGKEVASLALSGYRGCSLACGVDVNGYDGNAVCHSSLEEVTEKCDCIVDFSHHSATATLLEFAVTRNLPVVLCTTGHTEEEKALIRSAAEKIPVFLSANMSVGVALLVDLAKKTAAALPDAEIEIIESHHDRKLDAPSGTALLIAEALREVRGKVPFVFGRQGQAKRTKEEIGIHSLRMGNVVGIHEVIVATNNQTITLKHEAHNRALFAEGSLAAAEFLVGKSAGIYDMNSMLSE